MQKSLQVRFNLPKGGIKDLGWLDIAGIAPEFIEKAKYELMARAALSDYPTSGEILRLGVGEPGVLAAEAWDSIVWDLSHGEIQKRKYGPITEGAIESCGGRFYLGIITSQDLRFTKDTFIRQWRLGFKKHFGLLGKTEAINL